MKNPSNRDLHIMLARIEERQIAVVDKVDGITDWQKSHQENDSKQFKELNDNVNAMNKYAASVAVVAATIGASMSYLWKKISS